MKYPTQTSREAFFIEQREPSLLDKVGAVLMGFALGWFVLQALRGLFQ